ncbi:MAG: hypothetical protein MN733_25030 [Nitrososphaera sp.]|nr:hypothetical protein [Nitrososphaera sp.]
MGIPVSLKEVVQNLEMISEEMTPYINRNTGEIYVITDEDIAYAEGEDDEEEAPDWEKESISKAKEILDSDAWLAFPSKFDINEWEIMQKFANSQDDDRLVDTLNRAIHGKGAFRYFKDVVFREGMRDEWYAFRQAALEEIAKTFLEEARIPYA